MSWRPGHPCCENHDGAHVHGCTRPRQPNGAEHPGGCIIRTGDSRPSELIYERLAEQGRTLASQRDDLIAQGVDPADLDVPMHPGSGDPS